VNNGRPPRYSINAVAKSSAHVCKGSWAAVPALRQIQSVAHSIAEGMLHRSEQPPGASQKRFMLQPNLPKSAHDGESQSDCLLSRGKPTIGANSYGEKAHSQMAGLEQRP
jgi:hypothetical protein